MNNDKNNQGELQLILDLDNNDKLSARSYGSRRTDNSLSDEQSLSDLDDPMGDIINHQSQDQDRNKNQNSPKNSPKNSPPSDTILGNSSVSNTNSKKKSTFAKKSGNRNSAGSVSDGVTYANSLKKEADGLIVSIIRNLKSLVENNITDSVKALNQIRKRIPPSENTFEYVPLHEEPSRLSNQPFTPQYVQVKNNKS